MEEEVSHSEERRERCLPRSQWWSKGKSQAPGWKTWRAHHQGVTPVRRERARTWCAPRTAPHQDLSPFHHPPALCFRVSFLSVLLAPNLRPALTPRPSAVSRRRVHRLYLRSTPQGLQCQLATCSKAVRRLFLTSRAQGFQYQPAIAHCTPPFPLQPSLALASVPAHSWLQVPFSSGAIQTFGDSARRTFVTTRV